MIIVYKNNQQPSGSGGAASKGSIRMSRKPIQVPIELKEQLDNYQELLRATTTYGTIEKLINYYERNEETRKAEAIRKEQEEQKRKATMIYIGEEQKQEYMQLAQKLGFRNENFTLALLMDHYEKSPSLHKDTFGTYLHLINN